jgi:hypothetical protein
VKHRIPLDRALIAAIDCGKWDTTPTFVPVNELKEWLKDNVRARHKIIAHRVANWPGKGNPTIRKSNFNPVMAFGQKKEAALFKMRFC